MIIPEYKTLFVHIPKTAGQSVENFLLQNLHKNRKEDGADYLLKMNEKHDKTPKRLAHLTACEYVNQKYIPLNEFESYYKFSIIRNPFDRIVSFYKYLGFSSLVPFEHFIRYYLPKYFEEEYWFFRPQSDFIYNQEDELLIDFLVRYENLENDFLKVANRLSISFLKLPHTNRSIEKGIISRKSYHLLIKHPELIKFLRMSSNKKKHFKKYYDDKSRALVEKFYQRDFTLLKYTF